MSNRLPTVGSDSGNWGSLLNSYLTTEHNSDGTHGLSSGLVTDSVTTVADATATLTIPPVTTAGITDITLTTNCTLTFPVATPGHSLTLIIRQGNGGNKSVTWPPSIVKWDGGIAPVLTTTVNAVDIFSFFCADGTNWFGFVAGQDMK